jgi:hypothetical protein
LQADNRSVQVLNWTGRGADGYPPLQGRALPDDVTFDYWTGGVLSGEGHTALRHFKIQDGTAIQVDPIANRPRDFLEWDALIVPDIFPVRSSLTGIHAGLFYASHPFAFFSACEKKYVMFAFQHGSL